MSEANMLEHFQSYLKLRSRSSWEACDSVILMWRNSIAYIYLFTGIPFLLCVIFLAILHSYLQYFGLLIFWLLKPFFDRFILQVISVRFFRSDADYKTICKGLVKNIFTGLIGDITWRRFSLYRSARLPVRILEGNKGEMIARRVRSLKNGGLDFCALLTCICVVIELAFFVILSFFLFGFFAEYAGFSFDLIIEYSSQVSFAGLILLSLIFLIIEPLYMCMGFGLYINSRSIVEGWDIELTFNSFIKTKKLEKINRNIFPIVIIFVLFLFYVVSPMQIHAEEWYQNNSEDIPLEVLDKILSSEEFGSSETRKWIRIREINADEPLSNFNFDAMNLKKIIGFFLRTLLIVIIFSVILFLLYQLYKTKHFPLKKKQKSWQKNIIPKFANQINSEKTIEAAKKYFAEGEKRKAWAACLSVILTLYTEKGNIVFALNDTEHDCLEKINHSALWGKDEASQLILYWIKFAYAGIEPESKYFYEAILFCDELKKKLRTHGDIDE